MTPDPKPAVVWAYFYDLASGGGRHCCTAQTVGWLEECHQDDAKRGANPGPIFKITGNVGVSCGETSLQAHEVSAILAALKDGTVPLPDEAPGMVRKTYDGTTCWQCEKCGKTRSGRGCMRCLEDERDSLRARLTVADARAATLESERDNLMERLADAHKALRDIPADREGVLAERDKARGEVEVAAKLLRDAAAAIDMEDFRALQYEAADFLAGREGEAFAQHLERAKEVVATWPKWKQEALGPLAPGDDEPKPKL